MGHRPSHTDDFALSPHVIPGTGGYTFTPAEYEKAAVNETVRSLSQELAVAARAGVTPVRVGAAGSMEGLAQLANLGPQSANGVEISHAVLSGGRPVLAAGQAEIAAGGGKLFGIQISRHSGSSSHGSFVKQIIVQPWDEGSGGPLTVDAIRNLHQPPARHRVSVRRYPPGTAFSGAMRAGTCYVLAGTGRFRCRNEEVTLSAGTLAALPEGPYEFEVVGDEPLEKVLVWELPFDADGPKHN